MGACQSNSLPPIPYECTAKGFEDRAHLQKAKDVKQQERYMLLVKKTTKRCYRSLLQQLQERALMPESGLILQIDLRPLSRLYIDDVIKGLQVAFTGHYTISNVHQVYAGFEPFFSLCLTPVVC